MTLFSSYRLGALELSNRVVMAPMTRCRALGNIPNELMAEYYAQRASAGLIVTEGTAPSRNALGYARIPGIFSEAQVEGWRGVTRRVHEASGKIFVQLMHTGRVGHPGNLPVGGRVVAPSAVRSDGHMYIDGVGAEPLPEPEAMSAADLSEARAEFVQGARNAIAAGFDGVELHGANGYLLEQFLHPHTNRRTDEYGGSIQKRVRFVTEVASAAADAIGAERVGIRLSPYGTFNDLPPHLEVEAEYIELARGLRGLLYVHLVQQAEPGFAATAAAIKREFGGPLILCGGFDGALAEQALAEHRADLIAFARPFVSNPDFVRRTQQQAELAPPQAETFYTPGPAGYVDYPTLGG